MISKSFSKSFFFFYSISQCMISATAMTLLLFRSQGPSFFPGILRINVSVTPEAVEAAEARA